MIFKEINMGTSNAILYVEKVLKEETDISHPLFKKEIVDKVNELIKLNNPNAKPVNRKTIYSAIEDLKSEPKNLTIEYAPNSNKIYYKRDQNNLASIIYTLHLINSNKNLDNSKIKDTLINNLNLSKYQREFILKNFSKSNDKTSSSMNKDSYNVLANISKAIEEKAPIYIKFNGDFSLGSIYSKDKNTYLCIPLSIYIDVQDILVELLVTNSSYTRTITKTCRIKDIKEVEVENKLNSIEILKKLKTGAELNKDNYSSMVNTINKGLSFMCKNETDYYNNPKFYVYYDKDLDLFFYSIFPDRMISREDINILGEKYDEKSLNENVYAIYLFYYLCYMTFKDPGYLELLNSYDSIDSFTELFENNPNYSNEVYMNISSYLLINYNIVLAAPSEEFIKHHYGNFYFSSIEDLKKATQNLTIYSSGSTYQIERGAYWAAFILNELIDNFLFNDFKYETITNLLYLAEKYLNKLEPLLYSILNKVLVVLNFIEFEDNNKLAYQSLKKIVLSLLKIQ